jgi:hypothetical protein
VPADAAIGKPSATTAIDIDKFRQKLFMIFPFSTRSPGSEGGNDNAVTTPEDNRRTLRTQN